MSDQIKDDFITSKTTEGKVKDVSISSEMKKSFLSYAMSVIVSRALPDVRDGLKPVQRRILYGMNELGVYSNSSYKKSARIVGDVMGKYHPHGDSSIYEAMVRMSQDFSYRYPLVDGHGNFGSIDGDGAAAMRYTEARMSKIAMEMLRDIDKNTINFIDNYDGSEKEPSVLPSRYPNLLVNGSTGIAVGMATNIPPHNLSEVIDGIIAYMANKDITIEELMEYIKAPDFPTGGQILGLSGLRQGYTTGNGIIAIRAVAEIVPLKNKEMIVITEIPYQVNKSKLIDRIAELAKEKVIEGITDLRDESNRKGMRIVIELRKDVNPHVMLNNLYKYTQLQVSFGMNMIALVNGEPKTVNLKEMLEHYYQFQMEVIHRRTQFELDKALARIHIINALVKALNDVDNAVELIKTSKDGEEAKQRLIETYDFDDIQAKAILDMRLQRLTGLEIFKIKEEANELEQRIAEYKEILVSDERKEAILTEEILEIKEKYGDKRKSEVNLYEDLDIDNEDLIPVEDTIITVTNNGYIKRMSVDSYKTQNRGGVGMTGIKMHEDDYVEHMLMTVTHDYHLFFTNKGRVYKIKGYQIPVGSRQSKGLPIVNILPFDKDEKLTSFTSVKNFDDKNQYLVFVTKKGIVKRTPVEAYKNIRANGIIALTLREDDELLSVKTTDGTTDVILGASNGKAIRFNEEAIRSMGRTASGVKGMTLEGDDQIVGAALVHNDDQDILVITEHGYGKRTKVSEYRPQNRGGKGVKTLNVTSKNGKLVTLKAVIDDEDLIVSSDKGITIRTHIAQIAETKRATQGVRIIKLRPDHQVATVAIVPHQEEEEEDMDHLKVTQEAIEINEETRKVDAVELSATSEETNDQPEELKQIDIFDKE